VYGYTDKNNRILAVAYTGKQIKSAWHYSFAYKDIEVAKQKRADKINEYFAGLNAWRDTKASYKAERNKPHDFKVGEIVYNSWGYDQTNIDYYEIVKVSSNYVWLRRIQGNTTETGFMCGDTTPTPGAFVNGEITQHKADASGHVNFKHGSGSRWDGRPQRCSWYA
jgi:hypothetical protein